MSAHKVALITGSAKRVGARIAQYLHQKGMQVVIHYHHSKAEAKALVDTLNTLRPHSAIGCCADLQHVENVSLLIATAVNTFNRLDVVINNAATFDSTPLTDLSTQAFQHTLNTNLTTPFFLASQAAPHLKSVQGSIINMVDIRGIQPLKQYAPYCISKAGLIMATKSLAIEWAPDIRVNAIAPGVVLWPDEISDADKKRYEKIIARTPLKRAGTPLDIAKAAYFLIEEAPYMTGQILSIDGGRALAY